MNRRRTSWRRSIGTIASYAALFALASVFVLPFLFMLSNSFKDLGTVFEYPPSLIPTEPTTVVRQGKTVRIGTWTDEQGRRGRRLLILDQRPGEYLAVPETNPAKDEPAWVSMKRVEPDRHVRFKADNYTIAWTQVPFSRFLLNTLTITVFAILGQVITASLVAFGFSRLEWPGRNPLFLCVLATMMLPAEVTMIPIYVFFVKLGWIDTFLPLIVPAWLGGGAFFIFLFRQFFLTIPRELDEAARVDGCGTFTIYRSILMPLCKPIVATVAVFSFVGNWNDFLNPLIYLNTTEKFTLAIGLRFFQGAYMTDLHLLMAASVMVLLPVLVVFFLGQKYFVRSIVLTGTKG